MKKMWAYRDRVTFLSSDRGRQNVLFTFVVPILERKFNTPPPPPPRACVCRLLLGHTLLSGRSPSRGNGLPARSARKTFW